MSTGWENGELALSVEMPSGHGDSDRLVLRPLGLTVAGEGCHVEVPGRGLVDLHKVPHASLGIDLGQVEVTGPQARALRSELVAEAPGLNEKFDAGADAIVVMNAGDDVTRLLGPASVNADLRGQLNDAIGYVLNSGLFNPGSDRPMRTAMCPIHHVPEICPYQH